jgi:hypothetical protein
VNRLLEEKRAEKILKGTYMALARCGFRREHPTADNALRTPEGNVTHRECAANSTDENRTLESEESIRKRSQDYRCS